MNIFRKIMLGVSIAAWLICCLFLNGLGGYALIINGYNEIGTSLLISCGVMLAAIVLSFSKKLVPIIISAILDIVGTFAFAYPISVISAIPNEKIPKTATEVIAGRMYPAIIVTASIAVVLLVNFLDEENAGKRAERRAKKKQEKNRSLTEDEKIV